jgi:hypothetical protein
MIKATREHLQIQIVGGALGAALRELCHVGWALKEGVEKKCCHPHAGYEHKRTTDQSAPKSDLNAGAYISSPIGGLQATQRRKHKSAVNEEPNKDSVFVMVKHTEIPQEICVAQIPEKNLSHPHCADQQAEEQAKTTDHGGA